MRLALTFSHDGRHCAFIIHQSIDQVRLKNVGSGGETGKEKQGSIAGHSKEDVNGRPGTMGKKQERKNDRER